MKVKVKRWHGVAVWKWEIVDEDVSQFVFADGAILSYLLIFINRLLAFFVI